MFAIFSQAGKEPVRVSLIWKQEKKLGERKKKGMSTFPQLTDFTAQTYGNLAKLGSVAILIKYREEGCCWG